MSDPKPWFISSRWQEYEGEGRANLFRVMAIAAFYLIELSNYFNGVVDAAFHQAVTALAVGWAIASAFILLCLRRGFFPGFLKYLSTTVDVVALTSILTIADGPRSPLVVGYFLVIALSGLRLSLPLVRFASAAAILGYVFLVGNAYFWRPAVRVPRYHEAIFLLALGLTGILIGQMIRHVRVVAEDYASRLSLNEERTHG